MSALTMPWRVVFEWDGGDSTFGWQRFRTEEEALRMSRLLVMSAEGQNRSVKVTVEHRGEPQQIVTSIAPTSAASHVSVGES